MSAAHIPISLQIAIDNSIARQVSVGAADHATRDATYNGSRHGANTSDLQRSPRAYATADNQPKLLASNGAKPDERGLDSCPGNQLPGGESGPRVGRNLLSEHYGKTNARCAVCANLYVPGRTLKPWPEPGHLIGAIRNSPCDNGLNVEVVGCAAGILGFPGPDGDVWEAERGARVAASLPEPHTHIRSMPSSRRLLAGHRPHQPTCRGSGSSQVLGRVR